MSWSFTGFISAAGFLKMALQKSPPAGGFKIKNNNNKKKSSRTSFLCFIKTEAAVACFREGLSVQCGQELGPLRGELWLQHVWIGLP